MALTLGTVLTAARDRHPAFYQDRIPNAVVARYLSDLQNQLIGKAVIRDRAFIAQTAVVTLALSDANVAGTAGAGTSGGVPGIVTDDGFATTEASTGAAILANVTSDTGAVVLLTDESLTSATSTTLTKTGIGRTVNGDVDFVLTITTGKGFGQRREVLSNTVDTWTVAAWDTIPDSTSLFSLVAPDYIADDTASAVTALPSTTTTQSYLVKLDSAGVPYIDFTQPLVATVEQGLPLPTMAGLLPDLCQYWTTGETLPAPLRVVGTADRFRVASGCRPTVYTIGQTLYCCGESADWQNVASLELRYIPIAPTFTALTDYFLLPDFAQPALTAAAAALMALRAAGLGVSSIDPAIYAAQEQQATTDFLRAVTTAKRGRGNRVREVW